MMAMRPPMMVVPAMQLAPIPVHIPSDTPPGLEYLLATNRIVIEQQVEMMEMFTGINTNNRYCIFDSMGRRMYFAAENSDACSILCLGSSRWWNITIFDAFGRPVLQGDREGGCTGGCCNSVQVLTPSGYSMGGVIQTCEPCSASWDIVSPTGVPALRLQAPSCSVCCPSSATCCEAEFPVTDIRDGVQIGNITKHYGGYIKESFTAADTFSVTFPINLEPPLKATLIFAAFLIDFMYYEKNPR